MMVGATAIASVALVVGVVLARSDERSGRVHIGEPTTTAPTTTAPTANFPASSRRLVGRPSQHLRLLGDRANIPLGRTP